ncbi:MAG TPA: gephyrin-like molybdotransferase Glp [Bdellovibrionota bacterium]|nr:gephyrin-like molybdotransferase Glp [Bdellovibrionota bacterium]
MIPWREAVQKILKETQAAPTELVPSANGLDRVLAENIRSKGDHPPYAQSAMDGFAVRAGECSEGMELDVIGEVAAGSAGGRSLSPHHAIRIMTGGEIPSGADAVVRTEDTEPMGEARIRLTKKPRSGDNVRSLGEDLRKGDELFRPGTWLGPPELGMLAYLGVHRVQVAKRPIVAVLPTGNELVEAEEAAFSEREKLLFNSNGPMISAAVRRDGGTAEQLPIARDNRSLLHSALARGLDADVLITSGGVSVGTYDFVRDELEKLGVQVVFHQVAIRPGRPILFGVREKPKRTSVFALPGNPVSTFVTYEMFVRPALRKMLGCEPFEHPTCLAMLEEPIKKKKPGLTFFIQGIVRFNKGSLLARPSGKQGSHLLTSVVRANALLVLEDSRAEIPAGEVIPVIPLRDISG